MTSNPPSFSFFRKKRIVRRRAGVSPVIATTIIIAITVTLGLALWAYANAGVGTAVESYSQSVKEYGDFTKERLVVSNMDFDNPSSNRISLWIFNSGKIESNLCYYVASDPDRCRTSPSILAVERGVGTLDATDLCEHTNPTLPTECLTRSMSDENGNPVDVNDMRIPPGELRKFSFDAGAAINTGSTYEITIYSNTTASTTFLKMAE